MDAESFCGYVVIHHCNNFWVAVIHPRLALLLASCASATPRCTGRASLLVGLSSALPPAALSPSPSGGPLCVSSGAACWDYPLYRVHRTVDGRGEADIIRDLVDEARWPLETFVVSELGFYENRIEE